MRLIKSSIKSRKEKRHDWGDKPLFAIVLQHLLVEACGLIVYFILTLNVSCITEYCNAHLTAYNNFLRCVTYCAAHSAVPFLAALIWRPFLRAEAAIGKEV